MFANVGTLADTRKERCIPRDVVLWDGDQTSDGYAPQDRQNQTKRCSLKEARSSLMSTGKALGWPSNGHDVPKAPHVETISFAQAWRSENLVHKS